MTYNQLMAEDLVTVARLRAELATLLSRLDRDGAVYVTQRGQARAVLLDVERYRELLAQIEYLDDSLEGALGQLALLRGERARPLEEVVAELSAESPRAVTPRKKRPMPARARVSR